MASLSIKTEGATVVSKTTF